MSEPNLKERQFQSMADQILEKVSTYIDHCEKSSPELLEMFQQNSYGSSLIRDLNRLMDFFLEREQSAILNSGPFHKK